MGNVTPFHFEVGTVGHYIATLRTMTQAVPSTSITLYGQGNFKTDVMGTSSMVSGFHVVHAFLFNSLNVPVLIQLFPQQIIVR